MINVESSIRILEESQVELVHTVGSDLTVVNAARVSFNKESFWREYEEGWLLDKDEKLIRYLARNKHYSPFNHCFITVRVKAPIFVARQLVKHEYMPWNEVSRRYVDEDPEFYLPKEWRGRAEDKKQGSSEIDVSKRYALFEFSEKPPTEFQVGVDTSVSDVAIMLTERAFRDYKALLNAGVCPEQARIILPQNTMTEWYWSGTLGAFAKMLALRLDPHSQKETQEVAKKIYWLIHEHYPVSLSALMESYK